MRKVVGWAMVVLCVATLGVHAAEKSDTSMMDIYMKMGAIQESSKRAEDAAKQTQASMTQMHQALRVIGQRLEGVSANHNKLVEGAKVVDRNQRVDAAVHKQAIIIMEKVLISHFGEKKWEEMVEEAKKELAEEAAKAEEERKKAAAKAAKEKTKAEKADAKAKKKEKVEAKKGDVKKADKTTRKSDEPPLGEK